MSIARLIADKEQFDSVADAFGESLMRVGVGPHTVDLIDESSGLYEVRAVAGSCAALVTACDVFFVDADLLVSEHPPEIPLLFVSDMDSTMIGQECIDELADYAGIKGKIAGITERAMLGELDFQSALTQRVALLGGLEESAIGRCLTERIIPTPGAKVLSETLKAHGCRNVLVTGGFHHFADPVAERLGFDRVVGNRLGVAKGRLTGALEGPISDASTKLAVLREEALKLGEGAALLATGDGANDIPMIEAATYGFAYRAKPKARSAANGRINGGDLTVILTLLGIPRADWVGA
ncbi:phosphoserine phosphatase SerB [Qipengyuania sp. ASV99]|uniref:phosphoserine phosphatase SerB n=1 Tax=Qipengyuania sp. ASV99 TaxID=3399681 RepID=UPI003A4C80D4